MGAYDQKKRRHTYRNILAYKIKWYKQLIEHVALRNGLRNRWSTQPIQAAWVVVHYHKMVKISIGNPTNGKNIDSKRKGPG